ncbi:hypothetical protein CPHO_02470 [Corynebacterium phocae]|uniref:DUF3073 domain-containing protein n=1 Tax=Corynebacterium phocae TaxID=161895 RepID=A0A1L7D1H6_9CORY|nr:DUF3073 domain-containing protein [Corynebacterium phocae]APT91958.1 hypothetical protein CPHO_02470 [Corynebacterium phocae]KAA8726948.1 DUF3073 domain-containing protein [Corynebacterium phocae]
MGRGRAKAKQTKVARQLKYNTPDMDLASLQRELASQKPSNSQDKEDDEVDYAKLYADYTDYPDDHSRYAKYGDEEWDSKGSGQQ